MYGISGFVEKLNILKYINSMGNYVHYMYGMFGFVDKLKFRTAKIPREIVYNKCTECMVLWRN